MTERAPTALVLFASRHGHTARIAAHVGAELQRLGVDATVRPVAGAGELSPVDVDGVVLAASVHAGAHQQEAVRWARDHHTSLGDRPSAFLSVSLTAAEDDEESRAATREAIDEFLDATGWTPQTTLPVAGALQYREYDVLTRLIMRLIARRHGASTDTHHDEDFTDWEALSCFAQHFAAALAGHHARA